MSEVITVTDQPLVVEGACDDGIVVQTTKEVIIAEVGGTGTGDKTFVQPFTNTSTVVVIHNLGKYPAVTVINSAKDEVVGNVEYLDLNSLVVTFSASFSGSVLCN